MRKISWLLAGTATMAIVGTTATVQAVAASPAHHDHHSAVMLRFSTMTPVTGPYVGSANPIRGIAGGGLPWILTSGRGSLRTDGRLTVRVRGLVLADQAPVPVQLRGKNPFADFRAVVSCQSIGAGNTATVTNVSTANFRANAAGDSLIRTTVKLPRPCIAPIVFVTGPAGTDVWFAVTGG
jgi:hypothetical protein